MVEKIDLVIPYVNGYDPEWNIIYEKYSNRKTNITSDTNKETRYDGEDILKYVFRSISLYLPWINTVHLLVMMDSQVPEWIDRQKVHIVYHKDFIPEKYLPTFNSSVIELFIHNIPNLSENFIYINDDVFFTQPLHPKDFFTKEGYLLNNIHHILYKDFRTINAPYISTFINASKLAARGTDVNFLTYQKCCMVKHLSAPYNRKWMEIAYKVNEKELKSSITFFRDEKNVNIYYFAFYEAYRGRMKKENRRGTYWGLLTSRYDKIEKDLYDENIKEMCVNDIEKTTIEDKKWLQKTLLKRFPHKCIYEK